MYYFIILVYRINVIGFLLDFPYHLHFVILHFYFLFPFVFLCCDCLNSIFPFLFFWLENICKKGCIGMCYDSIIICFSFICLSCIFLLQRFYTTFCTFLRFKNSWFDMYNRCTNSTIC